MLFYVSLREGTFFQYRKQRLEHLQFLKVGPTSSLKHRDVSGYVFVLYPEKCGFSSIKWAWVKRAVYPCMAWFNNETNMAWILLGLKFWPSAELPLFEPSHFSCCGASAFPVWALVFPIDGSCIMQMYPLLVVKPPYFWSESCRHL